MTKVAARYYNTCLLVPRLPALSAALWDTTVDRYRGRTVSIYHLRDRRVGEKTGDKGIERSLES